MSTLKRYAPDFARNARFELVGVMAVCVSGKYVLYSDYQALQRELENLKDQLGR